MGINSANGKTYDKYLKVGAKIDRKPPKKMIDNWVKSNVSLILDIGDREVRQLEELFRSAAYSKTPKAELQKRVTGILNGGKRRALTIAKDQTGKLNAQLNEYKQTKAGIKAYIWRTTSPNPRKQDREQNGKRFLWSQPPEGGHPGQKINCMCEPEPVFTE